MFKKSANNQFVVENNQGSPMVHKLKSSNTSYYKNLAFGAVIVILGVVTGFFLSNKTGIKVGGDGTTVGAPGETVVGSKDTKTFRDSAEGELEAGGLNEEGTHKLLRPGGESQTVALTSSVLDLSKFEGKKVRVWGETFAGQASGWFMDVGKVEVLD